MNKYRNQAKITWPLTLILVSTLITTVAIGLATWVNDNRQHFPVSDSSEGRALTKLYLGYSHDIFLVLIFIGITRLALLAFKNSKNNPKTGENEAYSLFRKLTNFGRSHPIVSIIFIVYGIAIVYESSYLYFDMIGWYPDLTRGGLLDNFSIRYSFVNETMRRSDFRFFPLAHQDLHVLSWFTIHIKTWLVFNTIQLFFIIFFCNKIIESISPNGKDSRPRVAIATTILLLFHPSTAFTFFHVIYCERTLGLIFTAYLYCYIIHKKEKKNLALYATIILATIGTFTKDIAILLFIVPPIFNLSIEALKSRKKLGGKGESILNKFSNDYKLDLYLLLLIPIFSASYAALSLIPSIYANEGLYNKGAENQFMPDARLFVLIAITISRAWMATRKKLTLDLLDSINVAAIAYAAALWALSRLVGNDYLVFPIQIVIVINIGYIWSLWIDPWIQKNTVSAYIIPITMAICISIIAIEHWQFPALKMSNTYQTIKWMKLEQISNQQNFENLDTTLKSLKESGSEVNLIINEKSRLERSRFLGKLRYDRLIEYNPKEKIYRIKDGINKGRRYKPQAGDIVANIDKHKSLLNPILQNRNYRIIYTDLISPEKGLFVRLQ